MTQKQIRSQQRKALREKYRLEGVCILCGKERAYEGVLRCLNCINIKHKVQSKKYIQHKELGLCIKCDNLVESNRVMCKSCRLRSLELSHSLKQEVINYYGGKCINCGDTRLPVLQLDHTNNDGRKHRKELDGNSQYRTGKRLYTWLKKHDFVTDYDLQVLCANCHSLKHWTNLEVEASI